MQKKVSLVLSGGGARGIAHIGVIEELERQGFEIESISGTSMGALVGGMYATGKIQEYKDWISTLDKYEVFKLVDFTLSSQGFIKGNKVFDKMREFIPDVNIEDLNIDYTATATDLLRSEEVVFKRGSLYEAIRASISIPSVFTPIVSGDTLLVDGGVINNLPIEHVKNSGNNLLIVVDVNADVPAYHPQIDKNNERKLGKQSIYLEKFQGIQRFFDKYRAKEEEDENGQLNYFEIMDKTISVLTGQISKMVIEKYAPDILVNVSRDSCSLFDFYKAEELIEIGRYNTANCIEQYEEKLKGEGLLDKLRNGNLFN
ncbi:MAG: patatin-like phospholipase family protein [Bacteroidota bacterium]